MARHLLLTALLAALLRREGAGAAGAAASAVRANGRIRSRRGQSANRGDSRLPDAVVHYDGGVGNGGLKPADGAADAGGLGEGGGSGAGGGGGGNGGAGGDGNGGGGGLETHCMLGVGESAPAPLKLKPPCSSPRLPRTMMKALR